MTNEQMAALIQQGGNDELIPLLWERVRKLFYIRSDEWHRVHAELCADRGITVWDLKQVSYPAFLKAIEAFKPEGGLKLSSYIKYPLLNEIKAIIGGKNAINNAVRLDAPLYTDNEGNEVSGSDLLPDDNAQAYYEQVEESDVYRIVREAVDLLPCEQQSVIKAYFFNSMSLKDIGIIHNRSVEWARQVKVKALNNLRRSRQLRLLYTDKYKNCHF